MLHGGVEGRTYPDVMIKFSCIDRLPFSLTYGALHAELRHQFLLFFEVSFQKSYFLSIFLNSTVPVYFHYSITSHVILCNTYKDLSPDRCLASDNTHSELMTVFILEMRVGKFLKIETAEAICRIKKKKRKSSSLWHKVNLHVVQFRKMKQVFSSYMSCNLFTGISHFHLG